MKSSGVLWPEVSFWWKKVVDDDADVFPEFIVERRRDVQVVGVGVGQQPKQPELLLRSPAKPEVEHHQRLSQERRRRQAGRQERRRRWEPDVAQADLEPVDHEEESTAQLALDPSAGLPAGQVSIVGPWRKKPGHRRCGGQWTKTEW